MVEVIGVVKDEAPDVAVLVASGASFCLEVSAGRTVLIVARIRRNPG